MSMHSLLAAKMKTVQSNLDYPNLDYPDFWLSRLFLWSQYGHECLLVTIKIHSDILFKTTALKSRVFIRHRRSENSPPATQNSPAKFWWPGAQLYISFIQTWSRYVVENYIWRKRYLFFQEDIHRTCWTNNSSFCVCRWKLLYYWNRLAQKCAILASYRRDSYMPKWTMTKYKK